MKWWSTDWAFIVKCKLSLLNFESEAPEVMAPMRACQSYNFPPCGYRNDCTGIGGSSLRLVEQSGSYHIAHFISAHWRVSGKGITALLSRLQTWVKAPHMLPAVCWKPLLLVLEVEKHHCLPLSFPSLLG